MIQSHMEPTSVTIPKDLKRWAVAYAKEQNRSLSNLVTVLLADLKKSATPKKK